MIRAVLCALLLSAAPPAAAQTIAIVNGTLATGDGSGPIEGGTVVIRDGRVAAAGQGVRVPADAQVIDASGKWVTPGIVAGFSRLGLADVDLGANGADDTSARNGPFSAAIDVAPAINPLYQPIAVNRADGVTRALVAPATAKSIFAGQGAVIDTGADMDAVTRPRAFQFVELGETGANDAGGSRASAHVLLRNALREAAELSGFAHPTAVRRQRSEDVLLTRFDAAALVPVLQGRQHLLVHVERASDILDVLDIAREFPSLRIVLVGASEGWLVADKIARSGIPVIASAVNDLPASFEQIAATQSNVGRMQAAGVKVSIGMIDDNDTRQLFNERQYAGNLVGLSKLPGATGLSWGEALAAITSGPAKAIGMGGQIGSLTPGAHGDAVIWSGDPLDTRSAAEAVFIDGVRQPLETHQTRLLERYRFLPRRDLPEAYRH
jgi:imidazolonepropionase-like amidohydrolase